MENARKTWLGPWSLSVCGKSPLPILAVGADVGVGSTYTTAAGSVSRRCVCSEPETRPGSGRGAGTCVRCIPTSLPLWLVSDTGMPCHGHVHSPGEGPYVCSGLAGRKLPWSASLCCTVAWWHPPAWRQEQTQPSGRPCCAVAQGVPLGAGATHCSLTAHCDGLQPGAIPVGLASACSPGLPGRAQGTGLGHAFVPPTLFCPVPCPCSEVRELGVGRVPTLSALA